MKPIRSTAALLAVSLLLALTAPARAEDAPPGPPAAQPSAPAPAPAGQPETVPAARKEDEQPGSPGFSLKSLGQYLSSKRSLAHNNADLAKSLADRDSQITALQARIDALTNGAELTALRDENARLRTDLEGFANYAEAAGLLTDDSPAPAAQTKPGQAVSAVINAQVAKELRSIGHQPKPSAPATPAPAAAEQPLTPLQLIALGRQNQLAHLN